MIERHAVVEDISTKSAGLIVKASSIVAYEPGSLDVKLAGFGKSGGATVVTVPRLVRVGTKRRRNYLV